MPEQEAKYYAVSTGDGNDGVSHTFPRYIVKTDKPYQLAELAAISEFKEGEGQTWAKGNVEIDGEAEYTITACFYEGPEGETAYGAAWMIIEVFPADASQVEEWKDDPYKIVYESLNECFGEEFVTANPE